MVTAFSLHGLGGELMAERKPLNVSVGARIKAARKGAGLTQEQLAEMIGISPKNLSFIETGRFGVGLETLTRICTALHVSADALLFGEPAGAPAALCRDLDSLPPRQRAYALELLDLTLGYLQAEQEARSPALTVT